MTVSNNILHLMANAFQRFSSPVAKSISALTKKDYYFAHEALSEGSELLKDKGCQHCGHIGIHFLALSLILCLFVVSKYGFLNLDARSVGWRVCNMCLQST